ncbi:discoidin domain-containing protein [Streptomyces sp. NBC_00154]|uniref:galactose-binding domain-containing protein n=1 Tax=Streptomyces sp. NBC_00154 TaxID=2975670 RepID=UPI0022568A50|nr:discoidin domain-containing protein [Streptomyces sp. NBC_00154]MCX5317030.1 discoidin domain-containing protein [Streptomyces sp. NBC_00154]
MRSITTGVLVAICLAFAGPARAAVVTDLYASPTGSGSSCSSTAPCSVATAQAQVRSLTSTATGDIAVDLEDGAYPLTAPLSFGPADSGLNGHNVIWRAAPGASPVFSGAQPMTGWAQVGTSGVWKTALPAGITDTRQIYVNNRRATRARGAYFPAGFTMTSTGYTTTDAASLGTWKNPSSIEFVYHQSYIETRCPVASVSGNTITMAQPCWNNAHNNPGIANNTINYIENAFELLNQPGEWYLDKTGAVAGDGTPALYYTPRSGESLTGPGAVQVTVPAIQQVLTVAGTGTSAPVQNLQFSGLTFADATWLFPNTADGFVEQQADFTETGAGASPYNYSGLTKTPAAVDVAYATNVVFQQDTFTRLGSAGINVEKSSNNVSLIGNQIYDVSANGIQIGDITHQDQRPTNFADRIHDITVQDNYVHDIATEFISGVGIFGGFTDTLKLLHNEIANVPYDGISLGWGWGYLDNGGLGDYQTNPETTPTIAANNQIVGNYVHHYMIAGQDGGAVYTLGDQPNSIEQSNYYANSPDDGSQRGIYLDNGTQHYTVSNNVVDRVASWLLVNEGGGHGSLTNPPAENNVITGNWANTTNKSCCSSINTYDASNNDTVVGSAWPAAAQTVINAAGLEPAYAYLHGTSSTTNLALGATAAASSIYSSGYAAGKAVDGSGATRWATPAGTTSAWLTITFPQATTLNRVVLREAQWGTAHINTFTIDYWNGSAWVTAVADSYGGLVAQERFSAVTTTEIRLSIADSAPGPSVQEVEVYYDHNIAQGQPASQSSTAYGGVASHAVDGNTNGDFYGGGSVTHTNSDPNAWWQVDLGASYTLSAVNIYSRTDCCADRLSDYWIFVSPTPFDTSLTPAQQAAVPGVWSTHQTSQVGTPTTLSLGNASGRYLMIQLNGTNYLSLAEVQVFPR